MNNFLKGLFKGRLAGHPVHIMLVHFPVALFPIALVLDGLAYYLQDNSFALSAWYCALGGSFLGWFALLFGISDLLLIDPQSKAMTKGLVHGGLNLCWICVFSFFAFMGFKSYPHISPPSILQLVMEAIVVLGMFYSNYLGGELLFKHKIGLEQIDKTDQNAKTKN